MEFVEYQGFLSYLSSKKQNYIAPALHSFCLIVMFTSLPVSSFLQTGHIVLTTKLHFASSHFHPDHPSLPGPLVAPAGCKNQGAGSGPEGVEGSPALPHPVRLCHLPQSAGVAAFQPEDLWLQRRFTKNIYLLIYN